MPGKSLKCRNCGCDIDLFIGRDTNAITYLHVKKIPGTKIWAWYEKSDKNCINPEL